MRLSRMLKCESAAAIESAFSGTKPFILLETENFIKFSGASKIGKIERFGNISAVVTSFDKNSTTALKIPENFLHEKNLELPKSKIKTECPETGQIFFGQDSQRLIRLPL